MAGESAETGIIRSCVGGQVRIRLLAIELKVCIMNSGFLRIALVLGLVSAVGPFSIDMYLPALPTIGADLGASPFAVQMTLVVMFVASAVAPLVVGPLADMYGRKPVMYGGLVVFVIASIGAAIAPSIEWLIFFRLLQGSAPAPAWSCRAQWSAICIRVRKPPS